jgi:membrane fusion protein (multidrug efflux system)
MRSAFGWMLIATPLLLTACGDSKPAPTAVANAASTSAAAPATPPIAAATQATDNSVAVTGPIIVEHEVDMTAQRDGIVDKIYVDAPARVKTGTLLAELDGRQTLSNLEAARAKTRSVEADLKNWNAETEVLKSDYVRAQRMFDLGLTSEEQLQHAKFKVESDQYDVQRVTEMLNNSRAEEHSLELELEKTKIIAPFEGLIARRYVRAGQNVVRGDRLFWVTAEAPLLMRFTLAEKYFGKLHNGQQLEVTSPNAPSEKHAARVKQISPVVDPSSGTFEVLVELAGERGSLRPGMTASVRIDTPR